MEFNDFRDDLDKNLKDALGEAMAESKNKIKKPTAIKNSQDIEQLMNCLFMLSMMVQRLLVYQMKNSLALGRDSNQLSDLSNMINDINEMVLDVFPEFIDVDNGEKDAED